MGMPTDDERLLAFAEIALHNGSPGEALDAFARLPGPAARYGEARALEALDRHAEAATRYEALWRAAETGSTERAERGVALVRCHTQYGDLGIAAARGERALADFTDHGHPWHEQAVRLGVTLEGVYGRRGELRRANRLLRRLQAVADELGAPGARGAVFWNYAINAYWLGRPEEACELSRQALALFGETEHHLNIATVRGIHGRMLGRAHPDRWEEALTLLLRAHSELSELNQGYLLIDCETEVADLLVRADEPERALPYVRTALARPQTPATLAMADSRLVLAEALLAVGDRVGCVEEIARATAILDATHGAQRVLLAREWHRTAALHRACGSVDAALHAYRQALLIADHGPSVWS
ncbi:hypothetical protein [Streptomyces sp. LMG1-1-1.1]|uniref:hypothetical protein n=1 Tax=Streptomyces sp. LMG1-1-1.1 TaxID=3135245 RepID=UPI003466CCA8